MRTTEKEALQAGLSREAFIEPIPLDRQPPIKRRYLEYAAGRMAHGRDGAGR